MKPVRGNRMSALETAAWELEARREQRPLWKHLGGTQSEIACGVSIGIQDSSAELVKLVEKIGGRLPAHQGQDQAGMGSQNHRRASRALPGNAVDGRC
ncbi:MAG: hypothetical protein WKF30_01915 [Pyrinomonadaceae bacterium]